MTERVNPPDVAPARHFDLAVGYTPRPEPRRCAECGAELPPAQVGNFCELHRLVRKEGGW